jgi:hypothetical protein
MKGLEILLNTDCFVLNFYSRLPDFTFYFYSGQSQRERVKYIGKISEPHIYLE